VIDRKSRNFAAEVLREFVDGNITNDEFTSRFPVDDRDPALRAIRECVWLHYSDVREHRLTGKDALNSEARQLLERCLLFLTTGLKFEWPVPVVSLKHGLLRLVGLGSFVENRYKRTGDQEVWPFQRRSDYESCLGKRGQVTGSSGPRTSR